MKTKRTNTAARSRVILWTGAALWLAGIIAVMIWIGAYSNSPNAAGQPPGSWPEQSRIFRAEGRSTLMMFVHPRCPCSRASVGELARLLVQDRGLGGVHVLFINPPGMSPDGARTVLWEQAALIPGVTVQLDQDGVEAKQFGVETSGQTLLYSASGQLLFEGGITISRGHSGDNPGRSALMSLLAHQTSDLSQTPVFGCPLFDASCEKGDVLCKY